MKQVVALLVTLVFLVSCVPRTTGAVSDCNTLTGDFAATEFGFNSVADPALTDSFGPDATFGLGFDNGVFTSSFADPTLGPDPFVATGPFDAVGSDIGFGTNPLLPGVAPGFDQRFECEVVDNNSFTLRSRDPVGFDFNNDGVFEDSTFGGTFGRI